MFGIYFISEHFKKPQGDLKERESQESFAKYFTLRKYFFSLSEKTFFEELLRQNNDRYLILSKVRLEDIVSVNNTLALKEQGIKRNYIKSKHIDFIILDKSQGVILAAIELDGKSHIQEKQKKYDQIKNDILNTMDIVFYRVRVGEIYSEKIQSLFADISYKPQ